MKIIIKKILIYTLTVTSIVFGSFSTALAAKNVNSTDQTDASSSTFCKKLLSTTNSIESNITKRSDKATDLWTNRENKWSDNWSKVDQTVANNRTKADQLKQQHFNQLTSKVKNSTEKQAIDEYSTEVHNAVSVRRAAYDEARNAFRVGVKSLINSRAGTISAQLAQFSDQVNTAINTAKEACNNNTESSTQIRTDMKASLKTARENFNSERKTDSTVGSQIKLLITTRNNAFKAADQTFHNSVTTAKDTLQKAMGADSSSID